MPRVFGASSRKASNNGAVGISGIGIGYRRSPSWKWEGSRMLGLQTFTVRFLDAKTFAERRTAEFKRSGFAFGGISGASQGQHGGTAAGSCTRN
jgi:hypothetical protein